MPIEFGELSGCALDSPWAPVLVDLATVAMNKHGSARIRHRLESRGAPLPATTLVSGTGAVVERSGSEGPAPAVGGGVLLPSGKLAP